MNSTFKVVFNKARGALMVVNEVTSSVQGKGTKTVIATAVTALMAGSALAASVIPEVPSDVTVTTANTAWDKVQADGQYHFKNEGAQGAFTTVTEGKNAEFGGKLWVSAIGANSDATGLNVNGKDVVVTNKGEIYVTTGKDGVEWKNEAILADNSAKVVNAGRIVVKNAYGMRVGTQATATIENAGTIIVEEQGVGMELGGGDKSVDSVATNNGSIIVGDIAQGKYGRGVLIKDAKDVVLNNNGLIQAGEGATAIDVQLEKTSATINLGETSQIDGLIKIGEGTKVALNAKGMTGKLKVKAADGTTTLNIDSGSDVTLADRQGSVYESVNIADGKLTASIWHDTNEYGEKKEQLQNDNKFKNVTVGEKGVFNITKLNSGGDKDQTKTNAKPHNTLLIKDMKLTLDGGALQVAGQNYTGALKVGMSSENGADTLTINAGNYNFESLKVGNASNNVVTVAGGSLTVGDVEITGKRHGKLALTGGTTSVNGSFTTVQGAIELNGGTLVTSGANLFAKGEEADAEYATTDAWKHVTATKGVVELTDTGFEYSLADLKKGQELLKQDGSVKLVLNGTFKLGKNEKLDAGSVSNLVLADQTGTASDSVTEAFKVTAATTLGALDFTAVTESETNKNADSIALGNGTNTLTLAGNGGDVFKNLGAKVTTVTTGDLVLGTTGNSGHVNVENLAAKTLTVVGAFDAENVSFTADSSIKEGALLDVATLTSKSNTMTLEGTLVADVIGANVTVENSGVLVLGERQPASSTRALLAETPAAPEFVDQIQKVVTANKAGALVTTNMQGEALFAAAAGDLFDAEKNVGLYVDQTIGVDDTTGKLIVGNPIDDKGNGTVAIAKDAVVVIDTKKFGAEDTVFDAKLYLPGDAPVILSGLTTNTSFILATETGSGDAKPDINLIDNNVFFKGDLNKAENGSLIVSTVFNDKVTDDAELNDVIKTQLDGSHNQKNADVLAAIADTTKKAGLVNKEGTALTDKGVQAVEEYLVAPLTAGALNLAYDATAQVNAVVENRVLEKADGVWADVFYASNKDSERYGDFGYSADITGGTLGVDTTVSCGAKIGAAFTIGQGDADSEGTVHGYSTDADFYGISLYAGRNVADTSLRISGNLSYLMFENDIKGSVAGASADESLDGKAFTAGLRADWTAYEGAFTVAPHAGLRYTFLEMDDYRDLEIGDMNVVEMPFGVKVSGAFEPAAGWTLQPSVDFTVVPQLGDKDVDTVLDSVDVIDNLYNTELGVEAATGNFSFGLSYKYGFGKEDRKNQSLNLNARYMF